MKVRPLLLSGLAACAVLLFAACAKQSPPPPAGAAAALFPLTVQLDWVAEPEHGGFYQAMARGYFRDAGLDVTLVPGGPNGFVLQKVATGRADLGQSDSTNVLLAIAHGLPVINVGAVFQNDPTVLMLHADSPVRTFADLGGKTVMARPEWAFLAYLRQKYRLDFKIIPMKFSVANFIVDPDCIQMGYYTAEPYFIIRGGGKPPRFLKPWDAGFDAYTAIIANQDWAAAHPARLRAFFRAYIHGWQDYLYGDPTAAHKLMEQSNPNDTDGFLAWSRRQIIDEKLVTGRGADGGPAQIGRVTRTRFQRQIDQLEDLGIVPKGVLTVDRVVTTDYLP